MREYCKLPSSKLHKQLRKTMKSQDAADKLYSMTQTEEFRSYFGDSMIFDNNNEPTLESLMSIIDVKQTVREREYKRMLESGLNESLPGDVSEIVRRAVDFNRNNSNYCAFVVDINGRKSKIEVRERTERTTIEANTLEDNLRKFDAINGYLARLGMPVKILDPVYFNGEDALTIPSNANPLVEGLFGVVNLANNISGFNAITEEFGHFLVECAGENNIVKRCEEYLNNNNDVMKQIFGDQYETVRDYYNKKGKPELLAREALGRILSSQMEYSGFDQLNIIGRADNVIKNYIQKFKFKNVNDRVSFENLVREITTIARNVITQSSNDDIRQNLAKSKNILAHTTDDFNKKVDAIMEKLHKRVQKFERIYDKSDYQLVDALKRIFMFGGGNAQFPYTYKSAMWDIVKDYVNHPTAEHSQFLIHIAHYKTVMSSSTDLFGAHIGEMLNIEELLENNELSFENIIQYANKIKKIKNFMLVYKDSVDEMLNMLTMHRSEFDDEEMSMLSVLEDDLLLLQRQIGTLEDQVKSMTKKLIYQFYLPTFNPDGEDTIKIGGTSLNKEYTVSLTDVLEHAYNDINIVDRMLDTGYNSSDILTQLVSTKIKQQQEKIRLQTQYEINTLQRLYQEYGGDTKFMHQFDEEGKPTGYYINPLGIDFAKFNKAKKEAYEEIDNLRLDDSYKASRKRKWYFQNTIEIKMSKYNQINGLWQKSENEFISIRVPKKDERWNSDAWDKLTDKQRELASELLEYKHKMDCINGLIRNFRPYKCVQKTVSSITESVMDGNQNISGIIGRIFNYNDEDSSEYGDIVNDALMRHDTPFFKRIWNKLKSIVRGDFDSNIKETINMMTDFENRVYKRVPLNYVRSLVEISKISTNAFDSLLHYTAATYQHEGMQEIADIMDLTVDVANQRKLRFINRKGQILTTKTGSNPDDIEYVETTAIGSNINTQIENIINTQIYSEYKERGSAIFNDSIPLSKISDGLIRLTALSMLGYNPFTGVNNVIVGKSQMLINSFGNEYYDKKDWLFAEKEYGKLIGDYIKESGEPFKTSKLALIEQTFNPHNDWWEEVTSKGIYKPRSLKVFETVCGPSFMMHAGEHNLKMDTCIAILKGYKMLDKSGNESSLYDALEEYDVKNADGNGTHKELRIKDGYKKLDGTEFKLKSDSLGRSDLQIVTDRMNISNHRMHGIYDKADYVELKKYAVGRILMLFRNFMFPFFSNRWKGISRLNINPKYNIQLGKSDEGFYVTTTRFLRKMFFPNADLMTEHGNFLDRAKFLINGLDKHEKMNLCRMLSEMISTLILWMLLRHVFSDWDDDEGNYPMRFMNYFARRLQTELTYAWNPATLMDILQSPTPVMGPLQDWARVIKSIGDDHVLQSGPYKGDTRLEANLKRAAPIIPNVIDFFKLDTEDKKFKVFEDSFFYKNSQEKDE